jgi:hypothetical protein
MEVEKMRAGMAIIEEIQVFEQESGRVQMVLVGRLMKVNEKTIMVEHDIDCVETGGMPSGTGQRCGITYPILPHWGVRTRLAGSKGDFVTRHKGWDRRLGNGGVQGNGGGVVSGKVGVKARRPARERLVPEHRTSGLSGPYNAGNGSGAVGYGKGR